MSTPSSAAQSHAVQHAILQAIYSLFLGGIITALVIVGLFTFKPMPTDYQQELARLDARDSAIYNCGKVDCTPTPAEEAELRQIENDRLALMEKRDIAMQGWNRSSGILLIGLATALLALSLVRWDRAIVLSNGLLLGGLFTMVVGIGFTVAAGEGAVRFFVLLGAVAITVGLGFVRFATAPKRAVAQGAVAGGDASAELSQRVEALEAQITNMRRALGG